MTGIVILAVVLLGVFAATYWFSDRSTMSNWLSWVGSALSGLFAVLGGFDVHALLPYVGSDWKTFAMIAGMFLLVGVARAVKEV